MDQEIALYVVFRVSLLFPHEFSVSAFIMLLSDLIFDFKMITSLWIVECQHGIKSDTFFLGFFIVEFSDH